MKKIIGLIFLIGLMSFAVSAETFGHSCNKVDLSEYNYYADQTHYKLIPSCTKVGFYSEQVHLGFETRCTTVGFYPSQYNAEYQSTCNDFTFYPNYWVKEKCY